MLTDSTKKNLQMRVDAECGACAGKMDLAKKAKQLNLDAIHDTVHEMAKDEARHGRGMQGLLDRYFKSFFQLFPRPGKPGRGFYLPRQAKKLPFWSQAA